MRGPTALALAALCLGCGQAATMTPDATPPSPSPPAAADPLHFALTSARAPGGAQLSLEIEAGMVVSQRPPEGLPGVDAEAAFVVPGLIDSHVHLAFLPVADELLASGIVAAVDLAAPKSSLSEDLSPLELLRAGPMLTAPRGYPTRSWGSDGYGLECDDVACVELAVAELAGRGASVIKVAVDGTPSLTDPQLRRACETAHGRGMRVVAHALTDESAARAARAGVDALAHTPTEPLRQQTVEALAATHVISTLAAFGASATAIDNLRRLRAAGAPVLFGTDLGNSRRPGVDPRELAALAEAGMGPSEILDAMTTAPAAFWKLTRLGTVEIDRPATFVLLDGDPLEDPRVLSTPRATYIAGHRQ